MPWYLYLKYISLPKVIAAVQPIAPPERNDLTDQLAPKSDIKGALTDPSPTSLTNQVLDIITLVVGILAVLYLIWMGIQYIMSAGSPDKAKVARQGIINAVIGIIIVVAAYAIIRFAISIGSTINNVI